MSAGESGDRGLFSPTILGFLVASVVAVFALSVILATMSSEETPFRATINSSSAIGHKGLYTLLEQLKVPVAKTRINDQVTTGRNGVLVVVEPDPALMSFDGGSDLANAPNILLVLPKWTGAPDLFHDGWVSKVERLDLAIPQKVLAVIDRAARLVSRPTPKAWSRNKVGATPALDGEVQLIEKSNLRPLISDGDRILLGEFTTLRQRIWILADPDPIENHGIATPANTRFVLSLLWQMRRGTGRIVFDETVHGVAAPDRNPIQLLFQFPFVIVTVQILAVLALLLLATTSRFGGPEDAPPAFASGKALLIDNIASLMDRAGHQAIILRRYIGVKLAETARALHAPPGLDDGALAAWLDRVGTSRGVSVKAASVLDDSAAAVGGRSKILPRLFNDARDMYRWNKDMLDGTGGR